MRHLLTILLQIIIVGVVSQSSHAFAQAQTVTSAVAEKLKQDTIRNARSQIEPLLSRYCYESCQIVDLRVEVEEELADTDDLGFEAIAEKNDKLNFFINKVIAEIQIDDRITVANRARLEKIFLNHLKAFGVQTELLWRPVSIPSIGNGAQDERTLKELLEGRINGEVSKVISMYCPEQCMLAQINIEGAMIPPDDAASYPATQTIADKTGRNIMRIDGVNVEVTMDANLDESSRERIANVLRAKLKFVTPLELSLNITPFPESYSQKRDRIREESNDPYGLEKLRRMLMLFRDLASTKEIISKESQSETNSSSSSNATGSVLEKSSDATMTATESSSSSSKESLNGSTTTQQVGGMTDVDWIWIIVAALASLIIVAGITVKLFGANRDAKMLSDGQNIASLQQRRAAQGDGQGQGVAGGMNAGGGMTLKHQYGFDRTAPGAVNEEMSLRVKIEKIRAEVAAAFVDNPKVARETFVRILKEEGVEETAKYVHILGHMVVFNLLEDPNIQRDLYELSEYYHRTSFDIKPEDELKLLEQLKTKVTATEIRVLSRKNFDKFDFLAKLDADQIFKLIEEENTKVQSIVLTQLEKKRRMAVFEMYQGQGKVEIMNELSRADAIPREYLGNVATALNKKVTSRPEFDTSNLRGSDILMDLLENANIDEQRRLMYNLVKNNPETARSIKQKLVTVEMLSFLKDGHLLELTMGMERQDLLTFLMGTKDHIRDLLLSKAPQELAESWQEDLRYMASVDVDKYRVVEMKILARLRQLAGSGVISVNDINNMIFSDQGAAAVGDTQEQLPPMMSRGSLAA